MSKKDPNTLDLFQEYAQQYREEEFLRKAGGSPDYRYVKERRIERVLNRPKLEIRDCPECPLFNRYFFEPWNYRTLIQNSSCGVKFVEGTKIDVLFLGQAPGYHEKIEKKAFVGKAGKRLNRILHEIQFNYNAIFYNTCQCQPLKDREPTKEEIEFCSDIVDTTINYFNPRVIVTLGAVATRRLLGKIALKTVHGKEFEYKGYKVVPTYHPSAVNRGKKYLEDYMKADISDVMRLLGGKTPPKKREGYEVITTVKELDYYFNILMEAKELSFDLETTGLDFWKDKIMGIGFSWEREKAIYIPLLINGIEFVKKFKDYSATISPTKMYNFWLPPFTDYVLEMIRKILENDAGKSAHKGKFDIKFTKHHWGFVPRNFNKDTKVLYYLVDENYANDLETIVDLKYPDLRGFKQLSDKIASKGKKKDFSLLPLDVIAERCCIDCDATLRLAQELPKEMVSPKLQSLAKNFYIPLIHVYADAEMRGVKIDVAYTKEMEPKLEKEITELHSIICQELGYEINVNSPQQLADVLYNKLKLPIKKLTDTEKPSVDKEVLMELYQDNNFQVAEKIRKFRKAGDTLNRVFIGYTANLDESDRARYDYHFFEKGNRLGASKINILNPTKEEKVRRMFIAEEGFKLIWADFSQLELRVLAWLSQDPVLLQEFGDDVDLHCQSAFGIFGIPAEKVGKDSKERDIAKMCNFALGTYGGSAKMGLAKINSDLPFDTEPVKLEVVEKFIRYWSSKYRVSGNYLDNVVQRAFSKKELVTIFGHRRRFSVDEGYLRSQEGKANITNQARNYVIQSTASTICQLAVIKLWKRLKREYRSRFLFSLHDMIMVEALDEEVSVIMELIQDTMVNAVSSLDIELKVDIDVGERWR